MKKTILILSLFLVTCSITFAQKHKNKKLNEPKQATLWGFGAYYDFQNQGIAIDVRAKIPVYNKISISPRISFYPAFNNINEMYGGADVDYNFMKYKFLNPYVYIGGYYDDWINSSDFQNPKAKRNTVMPEGGLGVVFDVKCLHPYIEYRYNPHWEEGSIGVGLLFNFKCMFNSEERKIKSCPHF
ncbi:MAG: hypothetical protein ABR968_08315 [Bacteroidales bacterium]|jgi:hypothetical protein